MVTNVIFFHHLVHLLIGHPSTPSRIPSERGAMSQGLKGIHSLTQMVSVSD